MESTGKSSPKKMLIFGAVVLIFAVIGFVFTITSAVKGIAYLMDNSERKEELEWFITPVVMQDPPVFESPDKLTNTTIITAGVWRLIMNEDTSRYPVDEFNFITVPQSDIEVEIKSLFGDVKYTHETVGDTELMITYDSENKCYIFPAVPHVMPYTPDIQEIRENEDGSLVLTVGYIPPGLVWEGDTDGRKYQPEPDKIMEYMLVREPDRNEYRIHSVSNLVSGQDLSSGSSVPAGSGFEEKDEKNAGSSESDAVSEDSEAASGEDDSSTEAEPSEETSGEDGGEDEDSAA